MTAVDLPTLTLVIASAAIDSINPCAIGVLILLISLLLGQRSKTSRLVLLGSCYIFAIFLTYLLGGLGVLYFLSGVPLAVAEYISIAVAILLIIAGIIEIKDYFWYGQGVSLQIPPYFAKLIHKFSKHLTVPGVVFLGAFVAAVELPCTGAPYLAIITILSLNFTFTAFLMLVLYNVIFVMPLIILLILVAGGMRLHHVKKWKQANKHYMRLAIGLLLILLGWLLILLSNGTVNFG
jgi:cytochrome c biogenesis protein CcdA